MWENPRPVYSNELYHYGVLGMHWGIRRYQPYPEGHKTGKKVGKAKLVRQINRDIKKGDEELERADMARKQSNARANKLDKKANKYYTRATSNPSERNMHKYNVAQAKYKVAKSTADFWNKHSEKMKAEQKRRVNTASKMYNGVRQSQPDYKKYKNSLHKDTMIGGFLLGPLGGGLNFAANQSMFTKNTELDSGYDAKNELRTRLKYIKQLESAEKARKNYLK